MKINSRDIEKILPKKLRRICQVGICNPLYLERKKSVFCHDPIECGGPRWSAKPSDVLPSVKSIITLIHFTSIAWDYSVEDIILVVADILRRKLKIKTHVLDKFGKPDKKNLIGHENSFLESTGYDAMKKIILFKEIAYYAGLGQYGKNSLIINPQFGSDIKIQALFTEAKLEYDRPILAKAYPGCKGCNKCIRACPAEIIHKYKVISQTGICNGVVRDRPIIIGRIPKKAKVWDNAPKTQKIHCRICQSFCPVNTQHYIKNSLIFAIREIREKPGKRQERITTFLSMGR